MFIKAKTNYGKRRSFSFTTIETYAEDEKSKNRPASNNTKAF
jgi:hypothetical protein